MLYCILGDSGSGKDTMVNHLIVHRICKRLITNTTRPMRPGEKNGVQYNFVTYNEMKNDTDIVEMRRYKIASGDYWYYYTTKSVLYDAIINDYAVACSPSQFSSYFKELRGYTYPIVLRVPDADRLIRLINRDKNQDMKELCRRFSDDKDSISKYIDGVSDFYIIDNIDMDKTITDIAVLIKSNQLRRDDKLYSFIGLNISIGALAIGNTFKSLINIENTEVQAI